MKKIKKIIISLSAGLLLSVCTISPTVAYASIATLTVAPRADIIEWRYKTENNKIYRRQYNYSKQKWIGKWEFVANVVS